jgi:hypothetical protein
MRRETADVYCLTDDEIGHNEHLVGQAPLRVGRTGARGRGNEGGSSAWAKLVAERTAGLPRRACERSSRPLGVETIALLPALRTGIRAVPWADTIGALARCRK